MQRVTLAEEISKKILRDFKFGEALPSERELSERYSCNRLTLRRALKNLNLRGMLTSVSRNGHFISENALSSGKKTEGGNNKKINILVLVTKVYDTSVTNTIGGLIHHASILGVNLSIQELTPDIDYEKLSSHEALHPGMNIDAYIICGRVSFTLYELLSKSMRPCVMVGLFEEQQSEQNYELRCLQMLLSLEEPYAEAGKKLISLGHRKIMLASIFTDKETVRIKHILQRQFREAGLSENCIQESYVYDKPLSITNRIANEAAREIYKRIDSHTAVISICSGVFGFQLMNLLFKRKNASPSLLAQGSENDWFQDIYQLDRIYFERNELGGACIREVIRQLENGRLDFGIRYLPGCYIPGKSLKQAK